MRKVNRITSFEACEGFVRGFCCDNTFSDPMLSNEEQIKNNLINAIERPESHLVIGVFDERQMVGLFSFLVLEEERYLEMLAGLSRDGEAYREMLAYLQARFPSYTADFVFNPNNALLYDLLKRRGAALEAEQQKMVLAGTVPDVDLSGVEQLTETYIPSYLNIHNTDVYWTGEKILEATDRFRTFVAIENGAVVGYLDVTCSFEENEVFDLLVQKEHRRKGYGRKLLAKALERNKPNGMMLLVDIENEPAIHLYESMGFEKAEHQNSIVAHFQV